MKKILMKIVLIVVLLYSVSCEDFLERTPKDQLTEATTFTNYESILTYTWQFYDVFSGYDSKAPFDSETHTDLGATARPNSESEWIWQKVKVPTNSPYYTNPFKLIRACNIMLDNLDLANISQTELNHLKSVAYFFKAYNYIDLINKYGDITWVENTLSDSDEEILFGPRTPRDEVAKNILNLLQYAEDNINPEGDGPNTVNVHVVRALISRFGLREGTWRKYHGLGNSELYLNACVDASGKLLVDFPDIMDNYSEVFTSESLKDQPGIIFYKWYEENQHTHKLSTNGGSGSDYWDMTRKAIDMYLLRDGQTRWTSPLFDGDKTMYDEFRNRDFRLYLTTCPPYEVIGPGTSTTFTFTDNPVHREYFPIMDSLSYQVGGKAVPSSLNAINGSRTLPWRAWCAFVVDKVPHFYHNNRGKGWSITMTGYSFSKFSTRLNENISTKDVNDAPVFRIEEVMVNYAEAKKELGEFNQTICDLTINKLRSRGGVASLDINNISDDPTRDPDVEPVMWEIRRERAVELMYEGFRFDDLRRWKKMDYATERKLGVWINKADENNKVPTLDNAYAGYVSYLGNAPTPYPEHYYLYPIPSNQILISKGAIKQNPGWE